MDIDIYIDSVYYGFHPIETVEDYFKEYRRIAAEKVRKIDWDEVILYAIYSYDETTQGFISAEFMCLRMNFSRYTELCSKISKTCRLFCLKNR
ncbi:MAG: hypothetical protein K6B38_13060 [Ruminococcus sp.]|nr:hypothetical protein [Ruminococcus sp.]